MGIRGLLNKLKEGRERRGQTLASKRQWNQFQKEAEEASRVERETQKLERELPMVKQRAEIEEARARIAKARMTIRQPPFRGVSEVHAGFFGGGARQPSYRGQRIVSGSKRERSAPTTTPISLTGFEFGFGLKQPGSQQEKKKTQRYGAFWELL